MSVERAAFNVNDSAKYLGIDRVTFWELRAKRFIPKVVLPGGGVRYRRVVLDKLLKDLEVGSPQEAIQRNDKRRNRSSR